LTISDRYILLNKGRIIRDDSTAVISNDYVSNVMIVSLHDTDELHDLPEAETSEYKEDEMQLVLTLSENQVSNAVNWLMELIRQHELYDLYSVKYICLYTVQLQVDYG